MPNGLSPEQAAILSQLAAGKRTVREQRAAKLAGKAGGAKTTAGRGAEAAGAGMEATGKAMQAGGRATLQAGTAATRAGAEVAGLGTRKGGSQLAQTGRQAEQAGGRAGQMLGEGMPGGRTSARLQELAMKKMQARLAAAASPEEQDIRQAQLKRMLDTVKKFKKILKAGSAATVIGIIYLYLSFAKDYLLGNLINGDPTGLFIKKKGVFGVAPLSFPEVLLFWTITWSMFINWLVMWWPILLLAIIAFAVGTADFSEIKDLVAEFGLDVVNPVLEELGVPTIPGL